MRSQILNGFYLKLLFTPHTPSPTAQNAKTRKPSKLKTFALNLKLETLNRLKPEPYFQNPKP